MASGDDRNGVLERGSIYFLYRPKVEKEGARRGDDVERFYVVLSPEGKKSYREIIIGRKALPHATKAHERNWGFVKMVTADPRKLQEELGRSDIGRRLGGNGYFLPRVLRGRAYMRS